MELQHKCFLASCYMVQRLQSYYSYTVEMKDDTEKICISLECVCIQMWIWESWY